MIVLHIGLRKSGSTSVQTFLADNVDALKAMSIDYPVVGRMERAAHANFANELLGRDRFRPEWGALADLVEHRRRAPSETMVVSTEMFEALSHAAVVRLKDTLSALAEPVRVILIVRDLVPLMPSSYAEKVRYGHKKYDFDRFFEQRRASERVDYYATAKRWADVFGADKLRTIALGPRLIEDFVAAAGLPAQVAALPQPGVVNSASGWRVLEAMRSFHKGAQRLPVDHPINRVAAACEGLDRVRAQPHHVRLEAAARRAGDAMGWMADKGAYMTSGQAEWCAKTYDDAILAMNHHLGCELPLKAGLASRDFVARQFLPNASMIPASELRAFYDAVGEHLLEEPPAVDGADRPRA